MTHCQTPSENQRMHMSSLNCHHRCLYCHTVPSMFDLRVSWLLNEVKYFRVTSRVKKELRLPEIIFVSIIRVWWQGLNSHFAPESRYPEGTVRLWRRCAALHFVTQNPDAWNRDSLQNVACEFHLYMADNPKRNNCAFFLLVSSYELTFGTGGTPCIFLVNNQLDADSFFYLFISVLNMFRATPCSSSGEPIVSIHHLVCVTLLSQSKERPNIWNSAPVSRRRTLATVVLCSGDFKLYFHTSHITPLQLVIELRGLEWTCV
jgi:hypothetical protein